MSPTPLRIVHVEDNDTDSLLLHHLLKADAMAASVIRVETEKDFESALYDAPCDIIISDYRLPAYHGTQALDFAKHRFPDIPFLFFSGTMGEDAAVDCLKQGALDYVIKHRPERLPSAIRRALQHRDERTRRREAEAGQARAQAMLMDTNRHLQSALADLKRAQDEVIRQERRSALTQMVSGIVHDFNNALMPLVGLPDYLLEQPGALDDTREVRRILQVMKTASLDAREMVRRLREFYRPREGFTVGSVCLATLVQDVIAMTEPAWKGQAQSEGRMITVESDVAELPALMGDESSLREMMTNLVINASDSIPGKGTIRISARLEGSAIVLTIADTGVGMSDRVKRRCFEPFFTTKGEGGSGLGLSLCFGIVERHGGRIELDSAVGHGTSFIIHLPVAGPGCVPVKTTTGTSKSTPKLPPQRVLVIDDAATTRFMLTTFLAADGHTVAVEESGEAGLARFQQEKFDIVLTDRAMPGMSGDTVARHLRTLSPTLPIIMLTGFGDLMQYRSEHPEGVDAILTKPVTPDELRHCLASVLANRRP